jgi:hypothetical protein
MRNRRRRFSFPIVLWSPIARAMVGFDTPARFELRDDVWRCCSACP